jgi:hypothetical protein
VSETASAKRSTPRGEPSVRRLVLVAVFGLALVFVLAVAGHGYTERQWARCAMTPPGMQDAPEYPAWRHDSWEIRGRECVYDGGQERLRLPLWP